MTIDKIRDFCLQLPGVTEDIKWGHDLCFSVGGKMFLVTGPDSFPVSASFKTTEDQFEELCSRDWIKPAPYLAKNKWVLVEDIARFGIIEWGAFIRKSYELVFAKLPAKARRSIDLAG